VGRVHDHRAARLRGRDRGRPLLVVLDCKGGADSRRVAARARHGRPALLALRIAIAAAVSAVAFAAAGAQPAAGGLTAGVLTWLLLTARHDLAPPGT
jgi:hypothetical protein